MAQNDMSASTNEQSLSVGGMALDMAKDRIGVVMDLTPTRVHLRPGGGGLEWEADPGDVRPASGTEVLRARVALIDAARGLTREGAREHG
ncbi:hypothetical protein M1P56_02235 [Streptomyces sp. HU2014]|uniref:hypothetical protein n=1 Tax=Streptomyces sp. HU2014 TaxID=2939414 RepID=UPI00200D68DE|nr:hypothetical protein [Streptomyces sp. HU2014]UQI43284.1 hypothetical protein M1P56_02235 [Streptomyces sp. HU2014]